MMKTRVILIGLSLALLLGCAPKVSRVDLLDLINAGTAPPILDVRSESEYAAGHVPGAVHVPFYSVLAHLDEIERSDDSEPVVVYCEHGPRAGLARAGLWLGGAGEVRFMEGHMTAWKADGLPLEPAAD